MARDGAPQLPLLVTEILMGLGRVTHSFLPYVAFSVLCFALNSPAKAQTVDVSGSYACTQAKVQGKVLACTAR